MKRRTYRKWKNEVRDKQTNEALKQQKTTEYSREHFSALQTSVTSDNVDTNEIYFTRQKEKQWRWSGPSHRWRLVFAVLLVLFALIIFYLLGPFIGQFFSQLFY